MFTTMILALVLGAHPPPQADNTRGTKDPTFLSMTSENMSQDINAGSSEKLTAPDFSGQAQGKIEYTPDDGATAREVIYLRDANEQRDPGKRIGGQGVKFCDGVVSTDDVSSLVTYLERWWRDLHRRHLTSSG